MTHSTMMENVVFIDQDEVDFLHDTAENANPNNDDADEADEEAETDETDEEAEEEAPEEEQQGLDDEEIDVPEEAEQEPEQQPEPRRSGRARRPIDYSQPMVSHSQQHATPAQLKKHERKQQKLTWKKMEKLHSKSGNNGKSQAKELQWLEMKHNLFMQTTAMENKEMHTDTVAMVAARLMVETQARCSTQGVQFAQQHLMHKGLQKFGEKGEAGALKEMDQLHRRTCFTPMDVSTLTPEERAKAQEALLFLTEKRDGTIKG